MPRSPRPATIASASRSTRRRRAGRSPIREDAKPVMAALLAGATGAARWRRALAAPRAAFRSRRTATIRLVATTRAIAGDARTLVYHPRRLAVGIGCERERRSRRGDRRLSGARSTRRGSRPQSVALVASIDLKADEPAVLEAAAAARRAGALLHRRGARSGDAAAREPVGGGVPRGRLPRRRRRRGARRGRRRTARSSSPSGRARASPAPSPRRRTSSTRTRSAARADGSRSSASARARRTG